MQLNSWQAVKDLSYLQLPGQSLSWFPHGKRNYSTSPICSAHMKLPEAELFLDAARPGKHAWWRYLISLFVILVFWLGLGSIPTLILFGWVYIRQIAAGSVSTIIDIANLPMLPTFLATMLSFVFLLVGLFLAVRLVHQRRFSSLITPKTRVYWLRIGQGFGFWFLLVAGTSIIEALLYPGCYQLASERENFVLFAVFSLIFIPIQTSAEELMFRGYLVQMLGMKFRNPWVLSLMSGVLFGVLHLGNPEVSTNFWLMTAYYIVFGIFLTLITLWGGTLELVLGLHAANNLFSALFVTYPNAALRTPAIFQINLLDPVYNLATLVVALLLFAGVFFLRKNRYQTLG